MQYDLRLNCHQCGEFQEYHQKDGDPKTVFRCDGCGKKHSDDSIFFINLNRDYDRDERGVLIEELP